MSYCIEKGRRIFYKIISLIVPYVSLIRVIIFKLLPQLNSSVLNKDQKSVIINVSQLDSCNSPGGVHSSPAGGHGGHNRQGARDSSNPWK